jgi:hypothetical protein
LVGVKSRPALVTLFVRSSADVMAATRPVTVEVTTWESMTTGRTWGAEAFGGGARYRGRCADRA